MPRQNTSIGPYSRPGALAKLDGRTRAGRLIRDFRAEMVAHVGGKPSATQAVLIERSCQLSLQIALLDEKHATGGLTSHDQREYLAWTNTLTRLMRQLDLGAPRKPARSLSDHLAATRSGEP